MVGVLNGYEQSSLNRDYFIDLLTPKYIFFNEISSFPEYKGLYFLYYNSTLLYIGSASAEERTVRIRCQQYLQKGNGGNSFRGKIEQLKKISTEETIEFIKKNISAKFIDYKEQEKNKIKQLEQIAILSYQPPLNFMLNQFSYQNLEV